MEKTKGKAKANAIETLPKFVHETMDKIVANMEKSTKLKVKENILKKEKIEQ